MAAMDDLIARGKSAAAAVGDRMTTAYNGLRGSSAAPAQPASAAPAVSGTPATAQAARAAGTVSPEAAAYTASRAAPPVVTPPAVVAPGLLRTVGKYAGPVAGVAAGGTGAVDAGADIARNGANVDNTTNLAGNLALAGGSLASAPVAVAGGSFLAGKAAGGALVQKFLGPLIDAHYASKGVQPNMSEIQRIAMEHPEGQTAAMLRGAPVTAGAAGPLPGTAPVDAAPSVAAPAAAPAVLPPVQSFAAGSEGARGVSRMVNSGAAPAEGTGGFVNTTHGPGGSATQFNAAPASVTPDAQQGGSTGDPVSDQLRAQIAGAGTPRAQREAAVALGNYENQQRELGLRTAQFQRQYQQQNAELGDKRVKDFMESAVNNQYYSPDPKTGAAVPDQAKNARFLDFMRENAPKFDGRLAGMPNTILGISQLPAQDREKLVSNLKSAFDETTATENSTNANTWFTKPGISNTRVQLGTPVKDTQGNVAGYDQSQAVDTASVGDIPQIGALNYLGLKARGLVGLDDRVVRTDRGTVPAREFIGSETDAGSLDRRRKLAELTPKGLR